jgi:glycosyltransferase involved in cell wall biosynthesis
VRTPRFSVIVPTYGRPEFLAAALQSVLAQTIDDFEVLVIDDASPDPVVVPDDRRVRVLHSPTNQGPAAARNLGVAEAAGTFVAFLDDDDLWLPRRLELAVAGHKRAPVAVCWDRYVDGRPGGHRVLDGNVADSVLDGLTPHVGATSVLRSAVPPFEPRFAPCEDTEWWLRLAGTTTVATVCEEGFLYRLHPSPRHRTGAHERVVATARLLEEYDSWFGQHPKAAALRWKRHGMYQLAAGEPSRARRSFARSLRLRPEARTILHMARTLWRKR